MLKFKIDSQNLVLYKGNLQNNHTNTKIQGSKQSGCHMSVT